MQCWISVTSKDHVVASLAGGYMQTPGEKAGSLHDLERGDIVFFYSPGTSFRRGEVLQAFTGVARVTGDAPHQMASPKSVRPWRRDLLALPSQETPAEPLVMELSCITDKKQWASAFGRGLLRISPEDAACLAAAMHVDLAQNQPTPNH